MTVNVCVCFFQVFGTGMKSERKAQNNLHTVLEEWQFSMLTT
jgi:hypothetical protein